MMTIRLSSRVAASIARTDASRPISRGPTWPGSCTSVRSGITGYWPAVSVCFVTTPRVYDVSVVVPAFAQPSYELDQCFLCFVIELVWNVDLYRDVVVAHASGTVRQSLAAQAQPLAARRSGRNFHLRLAVDGRHGRHRAEDRAVERDPHVGGDVAAIDAQPRAITGFDLLLELGILRIAPPARAAESPVVVVDVLDPDPTAARVAAEELAE